MPFYPAGLKCICHNLSRGHVIQINRSIWSNQNSPKHLTSKIDDSFIISEIKYDILEILFQADCILTVLSINFIICAQLFIIRYRDRIVSKSYFIFPIRLDIKNNYLIFLYSERSFRIADKMF